MSTQQEIHAQLDDFFSEDVLTGWVIVAETIGVDGTKLHRLMGPEECPEWRWRGLLHEGLRDDGWDDEEDEDDEDDGE